jgi:hypothetical protein
VNFKLPNNNLFGCGVVSVDVIGHGKIFFSYLIVFIGLIFSFCFFHLPQFYYPISPPITYRHAKTDLLANLGTLLANGTLLAKPRRAKDF